MNPVAPILLVEDNPDDILFMRRAFRQIGISEAQVVEDGRAALEYLCGTGEYCDRTRFPLPRLVLLDLKLPYKNGLEVLEGVRSDDGLRPLPVIIFTSSAETSDVEKAYRLGANGYLVKPANLNELVNILQALKAFWLDYNVLPRVGNLQRTI